MRDFADQLERRLIVAARREEQRGPVQRLARTVLALPRLWLAAAPTAAVVAAGIVAALTLTAGTPPTVAPRVIHAQVVSFRYPQHGPDSGYIIATVTDPFAAQSTLDAAFKAAGLDITVTLVPASPSAVGTLVASSGPSSGPTIEALVGGSCVTGGGPGQCPIGVKIPRDFTGQGSIELGRPANPGEPYTSTNDAFAPGEVLHCSGLLNETVAQALPTIQADNITAYWGDGPDPLGPWYRGNPAAAQTPPAGTEYITDASPIAAGAVWFRTSPTPLSANDMQQQQQQYSQGC